MSEHAAPLVVSDKCRYRLLTIRCRASSHREEAISNPPSARVGQSDSCAGASTSDRGNTMSTDALLQTRRGVDALRAAFFRGVTNGICNSQHASQRAAQWYPYPTGTRPRVVSVPFSGVTYKVSVSGSRIRVDFGGNRPMDYDDIFSLAYAHRMTQESFDAIQDLIANPTETYELPDDAGGVS